VFSIQNAKLAKKMAIKITDECINCGACEPECPNNAIYEGGAEWRYADGTGVKGNFKGHNSGKEVDAEAPQTPKSMDLYYIVSDKCTECVGFHDEPQCAAVCPVDCCIKDEDVVESNDQLLAKKQALHV
jgi:ferredoxin